MRLSQRLLSYACACLLPALAACGGSSSGAMGNPFSSSSGGSSGGGSAAIGHVFVVVLENESAKTTFGTGTKAPYLAGTLLPMGAYIPHYYGIGHHSADNYIAMISGQGPNTDTQNDCQTYTDFTESGTQNLPDGQARGLGCVYPAAVLTVADQLDSAGLSWKAYMEDMGKDPTRESATCGHPKLGSKDNTQIATAKDMYATRHDPFVYFHSIIDNPVCDSNVVSLDPLSGDLASEATTPDFVFITPNLCHDGHDATCADGEKPGGLAAADKFLQTLVPEILNSPAYKKDGLLIITFDESESALADSTACCGETGNANALLPGLLGPGGGVVGAVVLSPFITAGTVSQTSYNHYSLLKTVEDVFGLEHLGYAQASGVESFGVDVCSKMAVSCAGK